VRLVSNRGINSNSVWPRVNQRFFGGPET
jgi:hypothetical protein